jgi:hypothetical protein|tara:strand:+ start:356 stop:964 length:609 start_codon:yes stop_codon:yes gene_type:complete
MKLQFDNQSFDIAISKNVKFVLDITDAIARKHWDGVKSVIKCTYIEFFEMLAKSAAQAFRKAYLFHFDDVNARDDDSFKALIEKFVGGQLLDDIHKIMNGEKEKPQQTLGSFGIGVMPNKCPADLFLDEENDEYFFKIEGITIEMNIGEKGSYHHYPLYFYYLGDRDQIEKFQKSTGVLVKNTNLFDDNAEKELRFSELGKA